MGDHGRLKPEESSLGMSLISFGEQRTAHALPNGVKNPEHAKPWSMSEAVCVDYDVAG